MKSSGFDLPFVFNALFNLTPAWILFILVSITGNELIRGQNPGPVILTQTECRGKAGDNIFKGGDFGRGESNILPADPGYAPGYRYELNPPPNDGTYTITNNTALWGGFADSWINIKDNSGDSLGYMMVVNASVEPGLFYRQTVELCELTRYEFSLDIISMNIPALAAGFTRPNISILINGIALFETGNVPIDSSWHRYRFSFFTSPGTRLLELSLRNNAPGGFNNVGNDLAIDNISLRSCNYAGLEVARSCAMKQQMLRADHDYFPLDTPVVLWQVSETGSEWANVQSGRDTILTLPDPVEGRFYRYLVAGSEENLGQPECYLQSSVYQVIADQDISREIRLSLCPGDSVWLGNEWIKGEGLHRFNFKTTGGCDSVISYRLEYIRMQADTDQVRICKDSIFMGMLIQNDTLIVHKLSSSLGCDRLHFISIQAIRPPPDTLILLKVCSGYLHGNSRILKDTSILDFKPDQSCLRKWIYRFELISPPAIRIEGDSIVCQGRPVTLHVNSTNGIHWSTGDTSPLILVEKEGNYSVTVSTPGACFATSNIKVALSNPQSRLSYSLPTCSGYSNGKIHIQDTRGGIPPYRYSLNGGPFLEDSVYMDLASGSYRLVARDFHSCESIQTAQLGNGPEFKVDVHAIPGVEKNTYQLKVTLSSTARQFAWTPVLGHSCTQCLEPLVRISGNTLYTFRAESTDGCTGTDSVLIVYQLPQYFFVPNLFTPNGDGRNDYFTFYHSGEVESILSVNIFDRWGNTLYFDTPGRSNGFQWDGTFRNEFLDSGVYVYKIRFQTVDGRKQELMGDLLLLR